jgi:hypothetical protein
MVMPSRTKWRGASTCVPTWQSMVKAEQLQGAPSAMSIVTSRRG